MHGSPILCFDQPNHVNFDVGLPGLRLKEKLIRSLLVWSHILFGMGNYTVLVFLKSPIVCFITWLSYLPVFTFFLCILVLFCREVFIMSSFAS